MWSASKDNLGFGLSKDTLELRAETLTAGAIGYEHRLRQPGASGLRYYSRCRCRTHFESFKIRFLFQPLRPHCLSS